MRVLMVTWGWRSHFYPLAPLGWALQAAGHQVRVAGQPAQGAAIVAAGLPAVPVGPDLDFAEVFAGQVGRVAGPAGSPAAGAAVATAVPPNIDAVRPAVAAAVTPDGGVVRFADAMLDELLAFGRHYRPDLVVYEPLNLAGSLVAAALGVPDVRLLWGPDAGSQLTLDEDLVLGPRAARLGVDGVRVTGAVSLDPCPAPMQVPLARPSLPMRFVPYNGPAVVPDWLRKPAARPRVCVTWGTMMAGLGLTDLVDASRVVHALAGLDIEVVVALEASQHATLGELPANVRLARSPLALHLVLPTCQALVHQGGAGTTMTGLACGVPQLVLPQVSDQHFNADRLTVTGAGTQLAGDDADPDTIRDQVTQLLDDDRWRAAAQEMRRRSEERPTPADLVPALCRLARTGAPTALGDPDPTQGHPDPTQGHPDPTQGHPDPIQGHPDPTRPLQGHPGPAQGDPGPTQPVAVSPTGGTR
ncbi:DUF1205 domain-containing protein [Micromonospora polyrhachis]